MELDSSLLILHDLHVQILVLLLLGSVLRVIYLVLGVLVHLLLLSKSLIWMHHLSATWYGVLTEL